MKHLVIDDIPPRGEKVTITGERYHYLRHVRRLGVDDALRCTDGRGRSAELTITSVDDEAMTLAVVTDVEEHAPRDVGGVTLYLALLKGKKFDLVVRQATEQGVTAIRPVITRHVVSRPQEGELRKKRKRWQQISIEAAQQSGRTVVPMIEDALTLSELPPSDGVNAVSYAFHETAQDELPGNLDRITAQSEWRYFVGPEGGLAADEVEVVRDLGWSVCRMPFPVLRSETAAVTAGALVHYIRQSIHSRLKEV